MSVTDQLWPRSPMLSGKKAHKRQHHPGKANHHLAQNRAPVMVAYRQRRWIPSFWTPFYFRVAMRRTDLPVAMVDCCSGMLALRLGLINPWSGERWATWQLKICAVGLLLLNNTYIYAAVKAWCLEVIFGTSYCSAVPMKPRMCVRVLLPY